MKTYHIGQLVRLNPLCCSEQEQRYVYVIVNTNDETQHAVISCINSMLQIHPSENVSYNMIEGF